MFITVITVVYDRGNKHAIGNLLGMGIYLSKNAYMHYMHIFWLLWNKVTEEALFPIVVS